MKRLFILAVTLVTVFMFSSVSFAAGAMTVAKKKFMNPKGEFKYKITLTLTHVGGAFSVAIPAATIAELDGFYLYSVVAYPGSVAATDDTDIVITASTGNKSTDILGGNGTNLIDATTTKETIPHQTFSDLNFFWVIDADDTYTVTTANATAATANPVLELIFLDK